MPQVYQPFGSLHHPSVWGLLAFARPLAPHTCGVPVPEIRTSQGGTWGAPLPTAALGFFPPEGSGYSFLRLTAAAGYRHAVSLYSLASLARKSICVPTSRGVKKKILPGYLGQVGRSGACTRGPSR